MAKKPSQRTNAPSPQKAKQIMRGAVAAGCPACQAKGSNVLAGWESRG